MDKTTQIVFIVFTACILVSVLIQCAAIVGMALAARKTEKKVHTLVDDLRLHILPVVSSSRALIEDLSPKIKVISADVVDTTNKLKTMAEEVSGVVTDVTQRTRVQAAHVDDMLEGTLHQITHATNTIQHGISVPVRQLSGIVNGLRAALDVMLDKDYAQTRSTAKPQAELAVEDNNRRADTVAEEVAKNLRNLPPGHITPY